MDELKGVTRKIGMIIRYLRRQSGFSQSDLAQRAELSLRHFQSLENGEINATIDTYLKLSLALNVSLETFFSPIDTKTFKEKFLLSVDEFEQLDQDHSELAAYQAVVRAKDQRLEQQKLRAVRFLKDKNFRALQKEGIFLCSVVQGTLHVDTEASKLFGLPQSSYALGKYSQSEEEAIILNTLVEEIPDRTVLFGEAHVNHPIGKTRGFCAFMPVSKRETLLAYKLLEVDSVSEIAQPLKKLIAS